MFPLEKMNNEQTKEKKDKKSLPQYGKANFSEKRQKIIAAAEDVVSEKGLREATIAEIAKAAGLSDSFIYHYFKGKEDLIFSLPIERENEFYSLLNEHLQGIWDRESQLRKIIWFYLWYCDTNPKYAKILHLDCLSSADFYHSQGYKAFYKYANILLSCLEQGVVEGAFRQDLDTHLLRDIIIALLGCEVVSCLAANEIDSLLPDLGDIMGLIMSMLKPRPMLNESKIDKILNAAEQVFAEKSIYKARVTEIAKIAGVSEGTVYEYFGNKEKLMLSIPERHLQRLTENIPELFEIKNPMRRLRRFIKYYFYNFSSNQNFLKTFLMQIQFTPQFYKTDQFKHFLNFFQIFEEIIKEGSSQGCFSPDINPRVFRNMLIGIFNNLTLRWFAQDNKNLPVDKTKKIDDVTNMLCFVATNFDKPPITMLYEGE